MLPPPTAWKATNNGFSFNNNNDRGSRRRRVRKGGRNSGNDMNKSKREVIKSDSNSSRNPTNSNNNNNNNNKFSSSSAKQESSTITSGAMKGGASSSSSSSGSWQEKISGWSQIASSWGAKTVENSSTALSKGLTDFNKQFKPQMEVAVDFVGPTWDRACQIAKPISGPVREMWLGLSPQTRAFVKPAAAGTAVAHIVLGFPSRRYARKLENKIKMMEKERVQLMVDDFSLEKEVLTLSAENRRLEKRVLRSEMALHAIRRRVAEFSLPNKARDAYGVGSMNDSNSDSNNNNNNNEGSLYEHSAKNSEMAWRKTQALKDAGVLQEREEQNVYENTIKNGRNNWSLDQNLWALGATVAAEEAFNDDGSAGTFIPPKY